MRKKRTRFVSAVLRGQCICVPVTRHHVLFSVHRRAERQAKHEEIRRKYGT